MTITEFLEARIAEDEAIARGAAEGRFSWSSVDYNAGNCEDHGFRWAPARVLAECAAKRAIIGLHRGESWSVPQPPQGDHNTYVTMSDNPHEVRVKLGGAFVGTISTEEYFKRMGATKNPPAAELRALATIYADHPDYRQEWAL